MTSNPHYTQLLADLAAFDEKFPDFHQGDTYREQPDGTMKVIAVGFDETDVKSFIRERRIQEWKAEVERLEKEKMEPTHADECLAKEHGDSYCDCSEYTATFGYNSSLEAEMRIYREAIAKL